MNGHPGKVSATLTLFCFGATPDAITGNLGLQPTATDYIKPSPIYFTPKGNLPTREGATWSYETASKISSSEIEKHLRHLLSLFLPLKEKLKALQAKVCVRIYWESILAGSSLAGLQIPADCVEGIAELGATLDIQVVKISKVKGAD